MDEDYFQQYVQSQPDCVDDTPWLSEFLAADEATEEWMNSFPSFSQESAASNANNLFEYDGPNDQSLNNNKTCTPNPELVSDLAAPLSALLQQVQQERTLESVQQQKSLPRKRSTYFKRSSGKSSSPIPIMTPERIHIETQSLAMQRWQDSPPQNEGASLSAICSALENPTTNGTPNSLWAPNFDAFRTYRTPPSLTSVASSVSSRHSGGSSRSAASGTSKHSRVSKKTRKPKVSRKETDPEDRIFKCTFCCDSFKHKYDWARHEQSLHLSTTEWQCAPHGGSVVLSTGRAHCAYCSALDPTTEHLAQHNHDACHGNHETKRSFRRKDHLVQHLRLFHGIETLPLVEDWRVDLPSIASRCGFCNANLNSWDERVTHLAAHYRQGKTMADWKGDHGFDAATAARVANALPPYLLADDSRSLVPFSATDPASKDHFNQMTSRLNQEGLLSPKLQFYTGSNATLLPKLVEDDTVMFAEVLAQHLSQFARHNILLGVMPTDEMFQREARRVAFGDEDGWNQTLADNQEWLKSFRRQEDWMNQAAQLTLD
ncbi:metal ion binding [Ascochyta rabiei]|uniref:Metal ion binding n=1 Tax=Didymella rabiei TaxID=5454 RepID=A0A163BZU6_DIDRA|nr:metal ion binding [Ascochyta rabiei]